MLNDKTAMLSLTCLGLSLGQSAFAAEADGWQYEVTPYLLAAAMDGTVGVKGATVPVDASFSDIWDNLDAGFMGVFTAQKGPWSFAVEGVYMKLGDEVAGPALGIVSASVTNSMYIAQGTVGYRVLDTKAKVDLLGALRWTKLDVNMDIVGPLTTRSVGGDESWTDAVVGVRGLYPVADQVTLMGYADVGGGGSDLTYQFMGGVNWEFKKDFTAKAGYRYLSWDYENDGTVWDMSASGPYLGLGIKF
jgi:hypothetical protein